MTLVGFKGQNHPQQIDKRGTRDDVDDRGTPPELFDPLHERFGFTVDVAAAAHNAKCDEFFTREDDGLRRSWSGERVWCNPPYNARDLALFTEKAWGEWNQTTCPCGAVRCDENDHLFWPEDMRPRRVELIAMLVPANRPEQAWWQDHVEPYRDRPGSPLTVEFLRDRRRFIRHDLGHTTVMPNERPPFGVCLLVWSEDAASAALDREARSGRSVP